MPKVQFLLIIAFIFSLFSACKSTSKGIMGESTNQEENYQVDFPFDALGYWEGDLHIYRDTGRVQSVPMALFISETPESDVYSWQIIYNPGKNQDGRPYLLIAKDIARGHYQIDEDNGIILDAFLIENRLISSYQVNKSRLTTINSFTRDHMIFEVIVSPSESINSSGNIRVEDIRIPEVKSYGLSVYQRAVLKKRRG